VGIVDPISDNGTYDVGALNNATGTSSNELSDHNPSGSGLPTKLGDFVCKGVGRLKDASTNPPTWSRYLGVHSIGNDATAVDYDNSSYNSNDLWVFANSGTKITAGQLFTVRLELSDYQDDLGDYFAEAVLDQGSGLTRNFVSTGNNGDLAATLENVTTQITGNRSVANVVDLQFQFQDYTSELEIAWTFSDGMNTNAFGYGTDSGVSSYLPSGTNAGLILRTQETEKAKPLITDWYAEVTYDSTDGQYDVDFNSLSNKDYSYAVWDPTGYLENAPIRFYEDPPDYNSHYHENNAAVEALAANHSEQRLDASKIDSQTTVTYYVELKDQYGNPRDVIEMNFDGGTFPSSDGTTQGYEGSSGTTRSRGTLTNPYDIGMSTV